MKYPAHRLAAIYNGSAHGTDVLPLIIMAMRKVS